MLFPLTSRKNNCRHRCQKVVKGKQENCIGRSALGYLCPQWQRALINYEQRTCVEGDIPFQGVASGESGSIERERKECDRDFDATTRKATRAGSDCPGTGVRAVRKDKKSEDALRSETGEARSLVAFPAYILSGKYTWSESKSQQSSETHSRGFRETQNRIKRSARRPGGNGFSQDPRISPLESTASDCDPVAG